MVYAGEDPRFAFRRMLISACEDVGQADPAAVTIVLACAPAFDRIGMPEGQYHLAHAALYLATAPKSNSSLGFFDALASVEAEAAEVPSHLKDASRDAVGFGHGEGYLYPHAYRDHWVAQQYLPDSLRGRVFYQPGALGIEGERRRTVLERREAQLAGLFETAGFEETGAEEGSVAAGESFAWSKAGEGKREWRARAEGSAPVRLSLVRRAIFDLAAPARDDRVLVLNAREGYLVWEALRRCPEGTVAAAARTGEEAELISHYAATLPELERPLVAVLPVESMDKSTVEAAFGFSQFDLAVGRDIFDACRTPGLEPSDLLRLLSQALPGAALAFVQNLPREGGRLSEIFSVELGPELAEKLRDFELWFYARTDLPALGPERVSLEASLRESGLDPQIEIRRDGYPRSFSRAEIDSWLSPTSTYGRALAERLPESEVARIASAFFAAVAADEKSRRPGRRWPLSFLYVRLRPKLRFPS